jgi:hypothetical protein
LKALGGVAVALTAALGVKVIDLREAKRWLPLGPAFGFLVGAVATLLMDQWARRAAGVGFGELPGLGDRRIVSLHIQTQSGDLTPADLALLRMQLEEAQQQIDIHGGTRTFVVNLRNVERRRDEILGQAGRTTSPAASMDMGGGTRDRPLLRCSRHSGFAEPNRIARAMTVSSRPGRAVHIALRAAYRS